MRPVTIGLISLSMLLSAAMFGFFYAWVCSTMWGLDRADPQVAITAMQAMNASVRNAVFAPAFFGTPVLLGLSALALWWQSQPRAALFFGASGILYLVLSLFLTMAVNVPMNEALGAINVPQDIAQARQIWADYSPDWQFWNQVRTLASGVSFLLALWGVMAVQSPRAA